MKPRNLLLAILVSIVLIVLLSVTSLLLFNTRRALPQQDGLAYVQGLDTPVEIIRDEYGVPHIYADNVHDLFYAQGYVHAQDRWWQMEFERHVGQGRIGELTGYNPSVLGNDLFVRTVGWNRSSAADLEVLSDESKAALDAYTQGVNSYIAGKHGGALALEYTLLGVTGVNIEVDPWTPLDSVSWAKVMGWGQSGNWGAEMDRLALYAQQNQHFMTYYDPYYPLDARPTILTEADLPLSESSLAANVTPIPQAIAALPLDDAGRDIATTLAGGVAPGFRPLLGQGVGSNSWVIGGQNTASGQPILANDPHLGIQMPSIWYEIGLHCRPVSDACPFDVVGFSLPGLPTILIGHDEHIAWGLTNGMGDIQDLYILHINPDNPLQYEYNGEWRDMQVATETIAAGDAYPTGEDDPATPQCEGISGLPINTDGNVEIEVRLTHFGPIITDNAIQDCQFVAHPADKDPLALRWTGLEPNDLLAATLGLNQAANWDDFRQALQHFQWPSINMIYADVDGNIGYQYPYHSPVRAPGHDGRMPVPGWTDEYEWRGYIPYDDLPRALNPERGWIVTANNAVVPDDYYTQLAEKLGDTFGADATYTLGTDYAFGYRGQRIEGLVSAQGAHTVDSVAAIQADSHSLHAEEVQPYLANLTTEDAALQDAIDLLLAWDLQTNMDSPQAALFEVFWTRLVANTWADDLGYQPSGGGNLAWGTQELLARPDDPIWDNANSDTLETRDDVLLQSLLEALAELTATQGGDSSAWRWGDLHTATFVNQPLGQSGIGLIESLFNGGPVPTSGSWDTINRTNWYTDNGYTVAGSISSMRMIVDLGDLDASLSIQTTGQSGHPFSAHYTDMIDPWRLMDDHPMRFGQESVEAGAQNHFELRPGPTITADE